MDDGVKKKVLTFSKLLLIFSAIFFISALFYLASKSFATADDFCNHFRASELGSLNYAILLYKTWTGRFVTSFILGTSLTMFEIEDSHFVGILLCLSFCFMSFILAGCISTRIVVNRVFLFVSALLLFWLGLEPVAGQVIFWPTGGIVYLVPYLIISIYINRLCKVDLNFEQNSRKSLLFTTIFSFISAALLETISPALFIILIYFLFKIENKRDYKRVDFWRLQIFMNIFGSITLILAPGNFLRANHGQNSFHLQSIDGWLYSLSKLYGEIAAISPTLFKLLIIGVIIGVVSQIGNLKKPTKVAWRLKLLFILVPLASLAPLIFVPDFISHRGLSFLIIQTGGFALFLGCFLSPYLGEKHRSIIVPIISILISGGLIDQGRNIIRDGRKADLIKTQLFVRGQLLLNPELKGKDVTVAKLVLSDRILLHLDDVKTDPTNWNNVCVSNFYKLKSIKVKD